MELVAQASSVIAPSARMMALTRSAHLADGVGVGVHVAPDPHRDPVRAQRFQVSSVITQLSAGWGLVARGAQAPGECDGTRLSRGGATRRTATGSGRAAGAAESGFSPRSMRRRRWSTSGREP